jgi:RNA polymerase sigma factor (sigma-70 family)
MGKKNKFLIDYRQREVMLAMGSLPLDGHLTSQYYIEDEVSYETVNPDSIEAMIEFTTSEELCEGEELKKTISDALDSLTPREAKLLRLRFGIDTDNELSLLQIASIFNLTSERIRQIEAKALRKMRHPSRSKVFEVQLYPDADCWSISTVISEPAPKIEDYEEWGRYEDYENAMFSWRERMALANKKLNEIKLNIRGLV